MKNHLVLDPSVSAALKDGKPVVALESTIISHGMPYPQNVETALMVEKQVRDNGAIPATIAVINGKMKAGLSIDDIELLGKQALKVQKVSRRDLPMIFATGGIGGVHRGAGATFDISADLQELAQTNVAVVCAGAKSILDIGLTLEYLETHGVPVVGFQTPDFPAFFTRKSGFLVDYNVSSEKELALMLRTKWAIEPLAGGVIVANPVPHEFEADAKMIEKAIKKALDYANEQGIKGKAITPFLLAEIERRTEGASLKTNIQLILNNAALAGRLAVAYSANKK
jgi:pseudouridylate synthase